MFHLEPNIKDCPGGLRDVHVCEWLTALQGLGSQEKTNGDAGDAEGDEFRQAVEFLRLVRCFLHYQHERDDNTLAWQAQDAAAEAEVGLVGRRPKKVDAAYWMRSYFRHARSVARRVVRMMGESPPGEAPGERRRLEGGRKLELQQPGFFLET